MNTKYLIVFAWICYFALKQTADEFWRFCLIFSCVMAAFTFFYTWENKPSKPDKKGKTR